MLLTQPRLRTKQLIRWHVIARWKLENGQGCTRNRKREVRLWWMRGFHEVRWSNWLLWLFADSKDLGWFTNPKGEYAEFSNSMLPKFYLSFWTTCPYEERFRHCFVTERKRQWEVREALKAIYHKLAFVTSDNPADAGRFMRKILAQNAMTLPRLRTTLMNFRSWGQNRWAEWDLITFRGWNWLAKWCSRSSCRLKLE